VPVYNDNLDRTNLDGLQWALSAFDWSSCFEGVNAQSNVEKWVDSLYNIVKKNTHLSKISIKKRDKPWFKNSIRHVVNVCHRMLWHANVIKTPEAWATYKQASMNCETTIAKAKNDYHRSLVENLYDYSTASKKWWSVINDPTGKKQRGYSFS
jgi:hypothetical protein